MAEDMKSASSGQNETLLECKLRFLKLELEHIDQTIGRLDQTTQGTKNWAVMVWAGSLGIALGKPELHPYILLTAILPLLFWYIDAQWRRIQRSFIFRVRRISEFINGEGLATALKSGQFGNFVVLDPRASTERHTDQYRHFTTIWRTLRFKEVGPFYLGLSLISIVVGIIIC